MLDYIRMTHVDLLKFARSENYGNEVACVIDILNHRRTNYVKGSRDAIDILSNADIFHVLNSYEQNSLILCHNHPGLSFFQ